MNFEDWWVSTFNGISNEIIKYNLVNKSTARDAWSACAKQYEYRIRELEKKIVLLTHINKTQCDDNDRLREILELATKRPVAPPVIDCHAIEFPEPGMNV